MKSLPINTAPEDIARRVEIVTPLNFWRFSYASKKN